MVNSLQLYQAVLFYLNRYGAPDFDLPDFRFFVNEALDEWLTEELKQFEMTQVISDNIRVLVENDVLTFNADGTTDLRVKPLSEGYRHLIRCEVSMFYKTATLGFAINAIRKGTTKRYTGDNWAYIYDNYYLMPLVTDSDMTLYARTVKGNLEILFDSPLYPNPAVNIRSAAIEFIKKPDAIVLADDFAVSTLQLPENVNRQIARRCAELFIKTKNISK